MDRGSIDEDDGREPLSMELAKTLARVRLESREEQYAAQKQYAALERELKTIKEQSSETVASLQDAIARLQSENTRLAMASANETKELLNEEIADQVALRRATQQERERLELMLSVVSAERDAARAEAAELRARLAEAGAEVEAQKAAHKRAAESSRAEWEQLLAEGESAHEQHVAKLQADILAAKREAEAVRDSQRAASARVEIVERDQFQEVMELQDSLQEEQANSSRLQEQLDEMREELERSRAVDLSGTGGGGGGGGSPFSATGDDDASFHHNSLRHQSQGLQEAPSPYNFGASAAELEEWMSLAQERADQLLEARQAKEDMAVALLEARQDKSEVSLQLDALKEQHQKLEDDYLRSVDETAAQSERLEAQHVKTLPSRGTTGGDLS